MSRHELDGGCLKRDAVMVTDRFQSSDSFQDFRRRRRVIVAGSLDRAGRQNSRIETAADQYSNFTLLTFRQKRSRGVLLQKREPAS